MKKEEWQALSPDGITIEPRNYPSEAAARAAFNEWKKRYEIQGYYSSCSGRISLEHLESACKFERIN